MKSFLQTGLSWLNANRLLLLAAGLLFLFTAGDYGDSWDEKVRSDEGEKKLAYYEALFSGDWETVREIGSRKDYYPGFHDLNLAVLKRISPLGDHLTGNLFSAFLGLLTIAGAMALARRMGGGAAAFLTGIFLLTWPRFYGHVFINPKDIPFAFGYIWSLCFLFDWFRRKTVPAWTTVLLSGLAIGVTMASRIGGLVLLCYLGLFLGLLLLRSFFNRSETPLSESIQSFIKCYFPRFLLVVLISMVGLLLYWPSGQWRPLAQTGGTLETVTHYQWPMAVFYEGAFYQSADLPRSYILKMFLLTTPLQLLLLGLGGIAWILGRDWKGFLQAKHQEANPLGRLLIAFAVLFPLAYVIIRDSNLYNGIRHLLFVVPPFAAIAGWATVRAWQWLKDGSPVLRLVLPGGLTLAVLITAIQMIRLHPYQYIHYNPIAGGTRGAASSYETDYWGTALKELAEEFGDYLKTEQPSLPRGYAVVNMEQVTYLFRPFLPDDLPIRVVVVRSRPDLDDYYAAGTVWNAPEFHDGIPVLEVQRLGISLAIIKDRRHIPPQERENSP
jgi:hypothetical protein